MQATGRDRGGIPGLPRDVDAMLAFAREHPLAVRWMDRPFDELVARHVADPEARARDPRADRLRQRRPGKPDLRANGSAVRLLFLRRLLSGRRLGPARRRAGRSDRGARRRGAAEDARRAHPRRRGPRRRRGARRRNARRGERRRRQRRFQAHVPRARRRDASAAGFSRAHRRGGAGALGLHGPPRASITSPTAGRPTSCSATSASASKFSPASIRAPRRRAIRPSASSSC